MVKNLAKNCSKNADRRVAKVHESVHDGLATSSDDLRFISYKQLKVSELNLSSYWTNSIGSPLPPDWLAGELLSSPFNEAPLTAIHHESFVDAISCEQSRLVHSSYARIRPITSGRVARMKSGLVNSIIYPLDILTFREFLLFF